MTVRADCTFYFAIVEKPSPTLSEVNTIDNNDYGITMKMIDFPNQPDSTGHSLQNEFLGTGSATSLEATPGLDNHVNQVSLRTLSFRKRLFDEKGHELTAAQDSTVFNFRLYLSNGSDDDLELANMAKYYVTDPDGMLCTWDSETLKFVSSNLNDYAALTAAEKARFTFDTSMYGAISNIPEGYCVEVPNIPVGTKFKVIEREKDIPAGYSFLSYERIGGSYHPDNGDTLNSGWVRANESPKMDVNNKRGWSIEVNKEWSDKDFTSSHDPVFIAVYCNNKLVPDTVSCIAHPSVSKRYFFDSLIPDANFEDYLIYEVELDNPVVSEDGELVSYSGIHKRIEDGGQTIINSVPNNSSTSVPHIIKVPNELNLPIGLTITKTVTGSFGDKTKDFTFTLDVKDADPEDEYSWSKNGVPQAEPLCDNSTFTLRHGDSVKIMLPVNSTVTITEISQNYSTSFKLNDTAVTVGNTKTFLLAEESIIAVTNNLDAIIPTGVFHTAVGMAVFILTAFCLLAFPVILRRIHKNKGLTA